MTLILLLYTLGYKSYAISLLNQTLHQVPERLLCQKIGTASNFMVYSLSVINIDACMKKLLIAAVGAVLFTSTAQAATLVNSRDDLQANDSVN